MNSARWERGYRCHGLWRGITRLGAVGLPPFGPVSEYRWTIDATGECGTVSSLKQAKREVEQRVATKTKVNMVWLTTLIWEDVTSTGSTLFRWRAEIGMGFWLHVQRQSGDATYTASIKHAGGLNVSKSGFRRFSRKKIDTPIVRWAKREATTFTVGVMERTECTETPKASCGT